MVKRIRIKHGWQNWNRDSKRTNNLKNSAISIKVVDLERGTISTILNVPIIFWGHQYFTSRRLSFTQRTHSKFRKCGDENKKENKKKWKKWKKNWPWCYISIVPKFNLFKEFNRDDEKFTTSKKINWTLYTSLFYKKTEQSNFL